MSYIKHVRRCSLEEKVHDKSIMYLEETIPLCDTEKILKISALICCIFYFYSVPLSS